ncbi:hypothetical protein DRQ29_00340 [bacterium]|nr:MAG: hypothetical protein DRQ29_00340 [bacterium]
MVEKKVDEKVEEKQKIWKYTDDIIAGIIVVAWIVGKFVGVEIPDWVMTTALGYVFGKNIPIQK